MENHHSSAAPPNGEGGSGSQDNKDDAVPNLSSAAKASATVTTTSSDDVSKGKSAAADDGKELKPHIVAERNRRNRMKDYFGELKSLVPQIPEKSDKATIVEHVIDYIKSIEKTLAALEKRKQERDAEAAASSVASTSTAPPPPQTAQGMALAAMSSDVPDACSATPPPPLQPPLAAAVPVPAISSNTPQPLQQPPPAAAVPAPPPQSRIVTARQIGFQTWAWPNLVLSVTNDTAYISVCAPRRRGMWTMVMVVSVLSKYGIDVVTAQIDGDAVRSVFNIYARVPGTLRYTGLPASMESYSGDCNGWTKSFVGTTGSVSAGCVGDPGVAHHQLGQNCLQGINGLSNRATTAVC